MAVVAAVAVVVAGAPAAADPLAVGAVMAAATEPVTPATGTLTAPDAVSAAVIARLQGAPVEVLGERTTSGSVFVLPDGTKAAGQGSGPVWVRRGGDGTKATDWAAVDLTLGMGTDGLVRPVAQGADLVLTGGMPASVGSAGSDVSAVEGLLDVATVSDPETGVTTRVQWAGALPAPVLAGRRATYADALPGVDLVIEATSTGFEQFFVVRARPKAGAGLSFPLTVITDGAQLETAADGSLTVVADGEVVATAPAPFMWDAGSDLGRAFPITKDRPAEEANAPRISPMPAWVTATDHGLSVTAESAVARAEGAATVDAAPDPTVGDGSIDPLAGAVAVERAIELSAPNVAVVKMVPQESFLQDPDTVFPVVVDPDVNFSWGFDTYVLKGYSNDRSGMADMSVGTYDGGAHIARTFIHFPTGAIAGKQILSARLELFNYYAWSCNARNWQVWSTSPAGPGSTWNAQPAWYGHYATSSETHGYSAGCGGNWSNADVTSLAAAWANSGAGEGYVGIRAENEADNYAWKRFYAANNGSYIPSIWVTYDSTPDAPTGLKISNSPNGTVSGAWVNTLTPTITATITDADGGGLNGHFWVQRGDNAVVVYSGVTPASSGVVVSTQVTPGSLVEGTTYAFSVKSGDCCVFGPQAPWFWFGVDTIAPLAPSVASTDYPDDNLWHKGPGEPGTFTIALTAADATVTGYRWALDKAPDPAQVVAVSAGAPATLPLTPTTAGRHVLQVQAVDRAGNVSGVTKHAFQVGHAGVLSPLEGIHIVRRVRLTVGAEPGLNFVKYQWRRGPDSPATDIADVPRAHLSTSTGTPWTQTWQALPTGDGYTTWDAGLTLGYRGGPIQVRAQVSAAASGSPVFDTQWVTVTVDPDASGAASADVGPGSVNLLTGEHTVSVTDAEEFGLSVVRTAASRTPTSGLELQADKLSQAVRDGTSLTDFGCSLYASIDSTRFHTGTSSIKLTPADSNSDSFCNVPGTAGTALAAGRSYRVSGWIYVPAVTGLTPESPRGLSLAVYTRNGLGPYIQPEVSGARTAMPTVTDAWQQVSVDVTIPVGTTDSFMRIYDGFTSGAKPVYFDDISVRELWAPFGPEWASGTVDAAAGTAYTRITRPYDDTASVQLTGGGEVWFTSGNGSAWWPEPGAEDLSLTATSPTTWRIRELDGTVTDFAQNIATNDFPVTVTSAPGAAGASRQVYDTATAPGISRLSRIIAPIELGVDAWPTNTAACTTAIPVRGCEVMDLTYAPTTSAAGAALGSFAGRVSVVSVWSWDPGTSAMVATPVATYSYDASGRLRQVSDPRIVAAGAPALVTGYDYDTVGRLTSVTAPGDVPFRFTYGAGGATKTGAGDWIDPSGGRLLNVTRASLLPGTTDQWGPDNTSTVVYNVPLTRTTGGPYDLDEAATGTWAQIDGPTDATAVFGPQDVPAVTTATASVPGADGYKPATVHYLNASGLEVNTASPASADTPAEGFIDTAEYDRFGNAIRTLDATNRLLALKKLPDWESSLRAWGMETKAPIELAQLFDTRTTYSPDGLDVTRVLGPAQQLAVGNDSADVRTLRPVTTNVYDEGKPDAVAYHLLTRSTSAGQDVASGASVDAVTTKSTYTPVDGAPILGGTSGWVHKQATSVTVDAGQPTALTSTVVYDGAGRPVRSSKPGSSGTDAATTVSVLYSAAANGADPACGSHPEWAGQPCTTAAAGPITGHDTARMATNLTVKRVEAYNKFGSPAVVSESVTGPVGGVSVTQTRTTVTSYDAADRVTSVQITGTGTGTGAPIAKTTTVYDDITGEVRENRSVDAGGTVLAAVTKSFDKLGQLITYTDGAGSTTTTTYDRYGQPATATETATDAYGTRTIGTVTYTYDRAKDPRGLLTSFTDSVAGTFAATWGPDGQLQTESLPGGVVLTIGYNPARVPVTRTYTRASDGAVIAADQVIDNDRGQWVQHTSDTGIRDYTYDRLGRLTKATDTTAGVCTTRTYGYDTHANRTSFGSAASAQGDPCSDPTDTAASTYDSADRLVTSPGTGGSTWVYDPLGRVTTMPTGDGTTAVTNGFYVNDLIATQTQAGVSRQSWGLDALQRRSTATTDTWVNDAWASAASKVSHYGSDSDEPGWIQEDTTLPTDVTRYVAGVEGDVAVTTTLTGGRELQLVDLHGDITATIPIADAAPEATFTELAFTSFDEFGTPQPLTGAGATTGPPARYGWLGAAQRSADTLGAVLLMGVRLYSPAIGRFLSVDPVPGGSASAYDYCNADPIGCTDLAGTWTWKGALKTLAVVGEFASMIPGPVGAIAGGVSAVAYLATGNKQAALAAAGGAVLGLVGLGAVAGAVKIARGVRAGKLAARAAPKIARADSIVIGQTMTRVRSAASRLGARTYEPGDRFRLPDKGMRKILNHLDNVRWIRGEMKAGTHIYDIGRNPNLKKNSSYYAIERMTIKVHRYKNVSRMR